MPTEPEARKLYCACGKPLADFTPRGLQLYCRFSKETITVPYGLNGFRAALAYLESLRRTFRP